MRRTILLFVVFAVLAVPAAAAAAPFPATIALPNGWRPEGIAIGKGSTFYVGSIPTGAVYRGDLRTGKGAVFVQGTSGRAATGIKYEDGRLFVAGASTGKGFVYDASTGALIREYQLATGQGATFVNDVVVTRDAAYFTDSSRKVIYRVTLSNKGEPAPSAETIPLSGDFQLGSGINLNGIEAAANGKTLLSVSTASGQLFTIDPASGVTHAIDLGGASLVNGDGILLLGRTLYVVQNQLNQIAVVNLDSRFSRGEVERTIKDPNFDVPTTIGRFGRWLYAVNARFSTPPTPATTYSVVRVQR